MNKLFEFFIPLLYSHPFNNDDDALFSAFLIFFLSKEKKKDDKYASFFHPLSLDNRKCQHHRLYSIDGWNKNENKKEQNYEPERMLSTHLTRWTNDELFFLLFTAFVNNREDRMESRRRWNDDEQQEYLNYYHPERKRMLFNRLLSFLAAFGLFHHNNRI